MNTITNATGIYTPSKTDVVHHTSASLTDRWQPFPVHLLQYDNTLPIIAVDLYANGSQYEVPSGAAVNIRMDKPDGKHAYNPAKGLSSDRHTAYFEVTAQMTAAHGKSCPAVEIVVNGGISGSGSFSVVIDRNPVPEDAYESDDEYKTIYQISKDVSESAKIVADNAVGIKYVQDNTANITAVAQNGTNVSAVGQGIENVNVVAESISDVQAAAENMRAIQQAPTAATNAAQSAQLSKQYAESINTSSFVKKSSLLDLVYPIGSIYITVSNASPAALFGGTWASISGRFLLATSSSYPAGSTGGESTHKLTQSELPNYSLSVTNGTDLICSKTGSDAAAHVQTQSSGWGIPNWESKTVTVASGGSGEAHNNMPPYLAVYMWKRTK